MSDVPVHSAKEALELLRRAAKARQSGSTGVNEHSSRSHAVITVRVSAVVWRPHHAACALYMVRCALLAQLHSCTLGMHLYTKSTTSSCRPMCDPSSYH
jgi:hypothetical protein